MHDYLGTDVWAVMADRSQLETALINLAVNARDAMPDGGHLTFEARNVVLDEDFTGTHQEVIPGEYVCLAVSDTGHGMPPEVREHVFEPFFTTKDVGKGSGLGLSMVYGFAKQSKGHVSIYSEVGHGTTVRLYLPNAAEGETDRSSHDDAALRPPRGNGRILVVEDEPDVRETAVAMLNEHGYETVEAGDGNEAVRRLCDEGPFDLLFTDVVLPGGTNGAQLAKQARNIHPRLKVLFTTGYSENAVVHDGRVDKGVVLISKPYRREELLRAVRAVFDDGKA